MNNEHEVYWLSRGNVVNRVFEMRHEKKSFLEDQEKRKPILPELTEEQLALMSNLFSISSISDEIKDEFLHLQIDSPARDLFKVKSDLILVIHTPVSMIVLLPFVFTCVTEDFQPLAT